MPLSHTDNLKNGGSVSFIAAAAEIRGKENPKLTHLIIGTAWVFAIMSRRCMKAFKASLWFR